MPTESAKPVSGKTPRKPPEVSKAEVKPKSANLSAKSGRHVCGCVRIWMVAQNPEVRAAAKYQPGYDGLPESGKKLPPCTAKCANGCAI